MTRLESALNYLKPADLNYNEWLNVGLALHAENSDWTVWDDWSKNDSRYHPGECKAKWATFHNCSSPVTGGTLIWMAASRGWSDTGADRPMNWDDSIFFDGREAASASRSPSEQLITYLETLFRPEEYVGYVTKSCQAKSNGRWVPNSRGVFNRTAGELIAGLRKHPEDPGAVVGDWKPEAGAWIRFNPLDGQGVQNENVTRFRYALVESDTLPVEFRCANGLVFRTSPAWANSILTRCLTHF